MRLFIGIDLPPHLKKKIGDFLSPLMTRPQGWEWTHDYHQTLLFIGETEEHKATEIYARLKRIPFKPFTLTTKDFVFFPRRVLYLALEPSLELTKLKGKVDEAFPEWIRPHEKEFIPHITVKRWQRHEYDYLKAYLDNRDFEPQIFQVEKLILFKSQKDERGFKYHIVKDIY